MTAKKEHPNQANPGRPDAPRSGKGRFIKTPEGAERQARVIRQRTAGFTWSQIAEREHVSVPAVREAWQKGITALPREAAREYAELTLTRQEEDEKRLRDIAANPPNIVTIKGEDTGVPNQDVAIRALREAETIRANRVRQLGLQPAKREQVDHARADATISSLLGSMLVLDYEHQVAAAACGHPVTPAPEGYVPAIDAGPPLDIVDGVLVDEDGTELRPGECPAPDGGWIPAARDHDVYRSCMDERCDCHRWDC